MGCVNSTAWDGERPRKKPKKQQKNNEIDDDEYAQEIKLLILGAGESGKSTILKQMKIIYDTGFNDYEKNMYRSTVFTNTIQSVKVILRAMEALGIPYSFSASRIDAQQFFALSEQCRDGELPTELSDIIKRLLRDAGVQECISRSTEYQLNDSALYYLHSIDRISMPRYVPTQNDIVRTRAKTTGIANCTFQHAGEVFRIIDVGGQRSERKKWTNVFNSVTAIIFCAAISEYDLRLEEDPEMNRLQESLELFGSICSYKSFACIPIILFLNKYDIFQHKIPHVPLCDTFPEYKGPNDVDSCAAYIRLLFEARKGDPNRDIYTQFTNATDTENISFVFNCCTDIISSRNLKEIFHC